MHLFKQIIEEFLEELNVPLLFDITKIPEEQLRKQYVNYEITSVPDHYGSPLIKNEKENYIVENKDFTNRFCNFFFLVKSVSRSMFNSLILEQGFPNYS